jgi:hypothetical protein
MHVKEFEVPIAKEVPSNFVMSFFNNQEQLRVSCYSVTWYLIWTLLFLSS